MEKYRQFADGGTGANPFVPPWSHYKPSVLMRLVKVALVPVAVVRLVLFSMALIWLAVTEAVCTPLSIVPPLRRPVHFVLTMAGCGLALFALGIWHTASSSSVADHRRLKLAPPKTSSLFGFNAGSGCLVLANLQGLTDVLYLGMKMCPVFVFPAADGTPIAYSLLGALRRAGARRPALAPQQPKSLRQIAEEARSSWSGPVVVFPEGARTNGTAVLAWKANTFKGLESFEKPEGTALVSIMYSKRWAYTPHHTVGTAFKHVAWLCFQPFHSVKSVWLPSSDVANAIKGKSLEESTDFLRTVLVRMIPDAVEVALGAEKMQEFMAFWETSQRKGYTKPSAPTGKAKKQS